ncbi:MAG: hypothetical protein IJQ12_01695 [Lachnospiraceae bacterium]|nr:hypothetical protein [Lachnospiraceae bacterium]
MAETGSINIYEDPKKVRAQIKQERKKLRAQEKQHYKDIKKREREFDDREAELDQTGGGITSFFLTVLIVLMWLLIMALLIRLDVGGFGSTVMAPILRDVPYLNRILPEYARGSTEIPGYTITPSSGEGEDEGANVLSGSATDNTTIEAQLAQARAQTVSDARTIEQLQAEINRLKTFEEQLNALDAQRTQFYNDIVYNDNAPDPAQYIAYFEMIDPAYAAEIYRQVVRSEAASQSVEDYARTYAAMKPKEAAAIFDNMVAEGTEHDVVLAARILLQIAPDDRASIMGKMEAENAKILTDIMEPADLPYPNN